MMNRLDSTFLSEEDEPKSINKGKSKYEQERLTHHESYP